MKFDWKGEGHLGARQGNAALFERLAQLLQHVAGELRQLVEKQDAIVREADFAGTGHT